ncbi:hypothetical protein TSH58_00200 [Azospirillum sp. TSH58]|nr:hypothetical protein TSH58_00200 [Azospirillum sp. TSH58]
MRSFLSRDDAMGNPSMVIAPSDTAFAIVLAPGVPKQITAPGAAETVLFNATGPFWCKIGGPAVLPANDVLDGSAPELNPVARQVRPNGVIGLVAPAAVTVSLVFYGAAA